MKGGVLVVNAGSSSLKISVFDGGLVECHRAVVSEIGGAARFSFDGVAAQVEAPDHGSALDHVLGALAGRGVVLDDFAAAGHRVVHGGTSLTEPVVITPEVEGAIDAASHLAPLHNPVNLVAIRALGQRAPGLLQTASFDTAFHAQIPDVAARYALPKTEATADMRRYGFHGTSYAALVRRLPEQSGAPLPERLLACHLGNGASLAAIRDGRSVATTMGYSPVSGLTMGTRAGEIDANAVLALADAIGVDAAHRLLNSESGLAGLSGGVSDMAELERRGDAKAEFAIAHFVYWVVRQAGSMIAALGGLDAIVFTGGIGEHSARVRAGVMAGLEWLGLVVDLAANGSGARQLHGATSSVAAWIVPAEEERQIAFESLAQTKGARKGRAE